MRNLIILFDGTWNDASDKADDKTNVEKLYRLLPHSYAENIHYEEGVGTKTYEAILGGAFGAGIDERILGAYRFLQSRFADDNYRHDENRIFIFGFSRGAYTARTFAQLLYYCGVPVKDANTQIAWDNYYHQKSAAAVKGKSDGDCFDVTIEMLGVWDTVKSTLDNDRNDTTLYPNVKFAYHAMAIDEKRKNFQVLRFEQDPRITQLWFSGVHCDVGGGYEYAESQLSDIALLWMIEASKKHGLEFIPDYLDYLDPVPTGKAHNSIKGKWKILGQKKRPILVDDKFHISIKIRLESNIGYSIAKMPANPEYII